MFAAYVLFAVYIILSTSGLVFIKMGSTGQSFSLAGGQMALTLNFRFLAGLILYIISFLLFTVVLGKFNLSTFYPMASSIIMVLSVLAGVLILKETLTVRQIFGIVLIITGVVAVNWKGN